jgi:3-hydroxybutyrate dehydrogenase
MQTKERKSVFVTGGTGSIGRLIVEFFSKAGYDVFFQFADAQESADLLSSQHNARSLQIDFSKQFDLPEVDFDVVVNNAGINVSSVLTHEVEKRLWDATLLMNITVPFQICQYYLPAMIAQKWGRIVNINSIYGLRGADYNTPYNVSKHALRGLTRCIAKEYASYGVTCNEICPGATRSALMNRIANQVAQEEGIQPQQYLEEVASKYPAGRLVEPAEIASVALFLASEGASYVNGVSIPVDGGLTC